MERCASRDVGTPRHTLKSNLIGFPKPDRDYGVLMEPNRLPSSPVQALSLPSEIADPEPNPLALAHQVVSEKADSALTRTVKVLLHERTAGVLAFVGLVLMIWVYIH